MRGKQVFTGFSCRRILIEKADPKRCENCQIRAIWTARKAEDEAAHQIDSNPIKSLKSTR